MRHDLEHFVEAQAFTYETALAELTRGRKSSHWMWFVFPQLRGLGSSAMAHRYGIASLDEARAYLAHPVLGPRLATATRTVLASPAQSLRALFGSPDDLKFRSSMTLFAASSGDASPFAEALELRCDGVRDEGTLARIGGDHHGTSSHHGFGGRSRSHGSAAAREAGACGDAPRAERGPR